MGDFRTLVRTLPTRVLGSTPMNEGGRIRDLDGEDAGEESDELRERLSEKL